MVKEDENATTPQAGKPSPSPSPAQKSPFDEPGNGSSSHNNNNNNNSMLSRNVQGADEFISSVAAKIAAQPLQYSDPDVWGVLTAISEKARKRHQGMNMLLTSDEHCIGRLVDDARFQIIAPAVSAHHCKVYRRKVSTEDSEHPSESCFSVFLKDTSTNGTFLNWEKLNKSSPEAKLRHGDIISIAFVPQHELAFAFVFREVQKSSYVSDGGSLKRKPAEHVVENKRLKGIGIGASDGPISLDDFRSLQRSNVELRKLLESQVMTIESLRNDNRAAIEKHETEMRELKESVSKSYLDRLSELNQSLDAKEKELAELNRISSEQKHAIEDLNERLSASMQSCVEANEIIDSQKASISELKALLDEERDQRREEREKASIDMKVAIQRVQAEATEEIKRVSDGALRREKEQQEMINKLQEAEKERCSLVETLRSKLEDTRQKLVNSDNKVRQLEGQISQEQQALASNKKRVEDLEHERKMLRKELEREKAAREEAWAKVSALELEINAAMRDLDFERRRLKGARERIMLRETQLRAFYSTTEEISALFAKQQEQLKAMQRTLEDEDNYENTSIDADLNPDDGNENRSMVRDKEEAHQSNSIAKTGSGAFHCHGTDQVGSSSDEASVTEKHECNAKTQEDGQDTQEVEFTSAEYNAKGGFGSDINGVGTAPILDGDDVGTEQIPEMEGAGTSPFLEGDALETERVLETESLGFQSSRNVDLNKCSALGGNTMEVDNDTNAQKAPEHAQKDCPEPSHHCQSNSPLEAQDPMEDTEGGGTIKTTDLLASEVAGSWACSTAPSVHGENDSPGSKYDDEGGAVPVHDSSSLVAESQHIPPTKAEAAARRNHERRALSEMIGIVAPDLREQFSRAVGSDDQVGSERGVSSNSDTEDYSDKEDDRKEAGIQEAASDAETVGGERAMSDAAMDEDDDDTQEDSV
ncbi:Non-specific serine/threonine protein kinase [Handroanthus impetiginosus]|uniref:Non-specific serine/threonine protein kinase n=1 Tax=Handroanthus impetiginosus TaxID=429701 RepID=A0A2G9I1Z6_9LAMI|nr:Non-specific serine/threonine protein kinase [Handroanthus impetiginosus]